MMDDKTTVQFGGIEGELRRMQNEIRSLRDEMYRVREQRNDAQTRFTNSQTKVAELEHRVRTQLWEISDLRAEIRTLRAVSIEPSPLLPVAPEVAITSTDVIEISDDEGGGSRERRGKPERESSRIDLSHPQQATPVSEQENGREYKPTRRQFMDCVSITRSPSRSRFPVSTAKRPQADLPEISYSISPAPGRFKRLRSESPQLEGSSSSTSVDDRDSLRVSQDHSSLGSDPLPPPQPVTPTQAPRAKRLKRSKTEDVKEEQLRDVADIHLKNALNLDIVPPPRPNFYVPRRFLLDKYGVLNQTFIGHFQAINDDQPRGAVFPQPYLNPFLPQVPGAAGLIFASRFEITVDRELHWALFCKHNATGNKTVWRYMGDYRNRHCGDLTAEQFKSQAEKVQQQWGKLLVTSKKVKAYVAMRARIALRKAGQVFVSGDAREMREVEESTTRAQTIGIIKLECVSYTHDLVADMAHQLDRWVPPSAKRKTSEHRTAPSRRKGKGSNVNVPKAPTRRRPRRSPGFDTDTESGSAYAPESEDPASESRTEQRSSRAQSRKEKQQHRPHGQSLQSGADAGSDSDLDPDLEAGSRSQSRNQPEFTPVSLGLVEDSSMSDLTELDDEDSD
ncbi:hypothetical protein MVEN_01398400 [Mycena venus]|uniref:DUF6697 domain-containing protein n=1 Tax=Mycena venus TaxID=2733690 RepID=A0A8H6XYV0_9AGAR|nr:hypothetical protein MVEN_01398400 [Mycena venus]